MISGATPLSMGELALQRNDFAGAEMLFRQVLAVSPQSLEALRGLGYALFQRGALADALAALEDVIKRAPSDPLGRLLMGRLCLRLQEPAAAEKHFQRILKKIPGSEAALSGMVSVALALNQANEARRLVQRLLALHPQSEVSWLAAATVAERLGDAEQAEQAFAKLISIQPQNAVHRYHHSRCLLRRGAFAEGWREYEHRFATGRIALPIVPSPRWSGEPVTTLLLLVEQGLGDTLQFSRFIALAKARVQRVVLACPPSMAALLARSYQIATVDVSATQWPVHEAHLPLMSLPQVLALGEQTLAPVSPCLKVDDGKREAWAQRLELSPSQLNIGVVHATSVAHETEQYPQTRRSCTSADLQPLSDMAGARLFNLSAGALATSWTDLSTQLRDFDDTAAVVDLLDVLVTVDTAAAHIAGGLGKPMALLLPHAADWRWMQDAERTAWYPQTRLFRQDQAGEWGAAVARACAFLQSLIPPTGR